MKYNTHLVALCAAQIVIVGCAKKEEAPPVAEVTATTAPQPAFGSDPSLSCEDAYKLATTAPKTKEEQLSQINGQLRWLSCSTASLNALSTDGTKYVVVGKIDPERRTIEAELTKASSSAEPDRADPNSVPSDKDQYKAACATASSAAMQLGSNPGTLTLAAGTAGAAVSCDAYVDAIDAKDPIILLGPSFVQGKYVTKKVLTELGVYLDARQAGQTAVDYVRDNPNKVAAWLAAPAVGEMLDVIKKNEGGLKGTVQSTLPTVDGNSVNVPVVPGVPGGPTFKIDLKKPWKVKVKL